MQQMCLDRKRLVLELSLLLTWNGNWKGKGKELVVVVVLLLKTEMENVQLCLVQDSSCSGVSRMEMNAVDRMILALK